MKSPLPAFLICFSILHWPPRTMERALRPKTLELRKWCPPTCVCTYTPGSLDSRNTPDQQLHERLPSASQLFFGLEKNFVCCPHAPICCAKVPLMKLLERAASSTPPCGHLLLEERPTSEGHIHFRS